MSSPHGQTAYATSNMSVNTTNLTHGSNASLSSQPAHAGITAANSLVLSYKTTDPTVDYDTNVTPLYEAIGHSDWDSATKICEKILANAKNLRNDAATWVVRYNNNSNVSVNGGSVGTSNILWRFLPIHSTCALSPPHTFLRLLVQLHPASVRTRDHQGLLPLHYACGARCSRECIYTLLMSFPQGSMVGDPRGMLPLHYLGQWGPSAGSGSGGGGNSGIVEMMLVATGDLANSRDKDGNTPLKLAQNATYPNHTEVANQIANHVMRKNLHLSNSVGGNTPRRVSPRNNEKYASFEDDITMDSHMQAMDFSGRKGLMNHGAASPRRHNGYSMVSFGDLLEDEERMDGNGSGGRRGDVKEVRDTSEISLGVRTPRGNNVWNKLGISPVQNPNKSKLSQHVAGNSSENWSIMSDPLLGNNHRVVSSPRRIDEISNGINNPTGSTPKPQRSFSWDAQDPVTFQTEHATQLSVPVANFDKYQTPRHSRDSARQGLPPMSPRFSSSTQRSNYSSRSTDYASDTRDDKDGAIQEGVDLAAAQVLFRSDDSQSSVVSKEEYDKLKMAKEQSENQMRMMKIEKEQLEIQLKMTIDEKRREVQQSYEARLGQEKEIFFDRETKLSKELDDGKKRIAELEHQLHELKTVEVKNASEREKSLRRELEAERMKCALLESQLKKMEKHIASNDDSLEKLSKEQRRSSDLAAQVAGLQAKIDTMQKNHGEAVYTHLQEVKSLRTSLEKATEEIEKSRAQQEAQQKHSVRSEDVLAQKEKEWKEDRAKLEGQIKNLTEASWGAQNSEYALKAELHKKEQEWKEDRAKLEAEVKHLKDIVKESGSSGGDGYSITSSLMQNTSFGCEPAHMKMQLDSAIREAEQMRNYNSTIRKEHGQTIADLESELEKERASKKDMLSQIVSLQYKVTKLESELEERDGSVEVALYGMRSKSRGSESMDDMEQTRRVVDAMRREAEGRERSLRDQLDHARRQIKQLENELCERLYQGSGSQSTEYSFRRQLNEARDQVHHLEERERSLRKELEKASSRERALTNQLKNFEADIISSDQEHTYNQQLRSTKSQLKELQEREDSYLKEIRDLKLRISELEANDHGLDTKLWEAKKSQQWALQEKEDEFNTKIRDIKKEYENTIVETQNLHLKELRDVKRELQSTFREKEDLYMQQLHDAKRKEQALKEREDELTKQINDAQMKLSLDDLDIEGMLKKKDDEFARLLEDASREKTARIAELTNEVERLEGELRDNDAQSIKEELLECKKELEKQRRAHKSEMNKLNNAMDLQKSKENRLQSHIKSMEEQITGMVSDYEARLEEAYYANLRK